LDNVCIRNLRYPGRQRQRETIIEVFKKKRSYIDTEDKGNKDERDDNI
jgi:hypothetical protein